MERFFSTLKTERVHRRPELRGIRWFPALPGESIGRFFGSDLLSGIHCEEDWAVS